MKKIDIILTLFTSEALAIYFIFLFKSYERLQDYQIFLYSLVIFFPILALFAIWLSYLIGKKYIFVFQLAKFVLIGALFALLDLGILNVLMKWFNITEGIKYTIFVAISFLIATTMKYVADKFWAFEKTERKKMGLEFTGFFVITLISGGIQIGIASLVVNTIGPLFGIPALTWANIGKILGIAVASIWNFLGYKFVVFKK